ncbi:hypothetical protein B566_EDAN018153 [Ephemera danica]|nr:hypothetical protein B566_EDAN018153 [Ephemera danica]
MSYVASSFLQKMSFPVGYVVAGGPTHQCSQCGKCYASNYEMTKHFKNIHFSQPATCEICNKTYKNKESLRTHKNKKHRNKKCFAVDYVRVVVDDDSAQCSECGKSFASNCEMSKHFNSIHGTGSAETNLKASNPARRFPCHLCSRSYIYKGDLNVHLNMIHGKDSMPVICHNCGRQYKNKKRHEFGRANPAENSGDEDRFYCTLCPKSYLNINGLKKHINYIHDKYSMPMSCDMCNKIYKNKRSLMEHIRNTHSRDASSFCRFCNAKFKMNKTRYGAAQKNIKVVPPRTEKSFARNLEVICEYCHKTYKNKKSLSQHQRISHTGPDAGLSFSCRYCAQVFTRKDNRDFHEKRICTRAGRPETW